MMDEVLALFQEATGVVYDGNLYGLPINLDDREVLEGNGDLNNDNESDIDEDVLVEDEGEEDTESASDEEHVDPAAGGDNTDWVPVPQVFPAIPVKINPYIDAETHGPTHNLPYSASPFEFFSLFFTEELERLVGRKAACYWCSKTKQRTTSGRTSETVFGCIICKIHLHKGDCFASFHQDLAKHQ